MPTPPDSSEPPRDPRDIFQPSTYRPIPQLPPEVERERYLFLAALTQTTEILQAGGITDPAEVRRIHADVLARLQDEAD